MEKPKRGRPRKVITPPIGDTILEPKEESVQPCTTQNKSYTAILALGDTIFESKGKSVLEALDGLQAPVKITTKSILTVRNGDRIYSRVLTIPLAKRLFMPISQAHLAKSIELQLK